MHDIPLVKLKAFDQIVLLTTLEMLLTMQSEKPACTWVLSALPCGIQSRDPSVPGLNSMKALNGGAEPLSSEEWYFI